MGAFAMNLPISVRLLSVLLFLTVSAQAQDNRYDLLGRMLMPFVNVFAKNTSNPNRALSCTLKLEQVTDLPAALVGSQAEIAVEYPDKIRLRAPILGEDVTVCRHGDEVWAYPGSKVEAMLKAAAEQKKLPKLNPKFRLEPFSLPVPEKELVFLPALFQAKDVGSEALDGVTCRVIDVYLMPELAKAVGRACLDSARRQARADFRGQAWLDGGRAFRPGAIRAETAGEHLGTDQRAGRGRAQAGRRAVSAVAERDGEVMG
jgi:hypothetical protein